MNAKTATQAPNRAMPVHPLREWTTQQHQYPGTRKPRVQSGVAKPVAVNTMATTVPATPQPMA
jgi:hypothetical protein